MLKIKSVEEGSIAEELGLLEGDKVVKINNQVACDVLSFLAEESKPKMKILVEKADQSQELLSVKKDPMEGLGVEFEENFCTRECKNHCIFCFVDQLPKNMRKTLYVKDDDYRLSFSEGNYVTLTNTSKEDIKRIKKLRLSPLYVSVHAITPRVRESMLNNHNHKDILKTIKDLAKYVDIHAQIVLVPGYNDGDELKKTLKAILPYTKSVAVVPVGLTAHRQGLPKLRAVDKAVATQTIDTIESMQQSSLERFGSRRVFAADEFYVVAGKKLPDAETYEDFSQIENGVGMLSKFEFEFFEKLKDVQKSSKNVEVSIATGKSAYPMIKKLAECLHEKCKNVNVSVYQIDNNFFGTSITTTGLLVGRDIIDQLKGKKLGDKLLLSKTMLREQTDVFLDDTKVSDVEHAMDIKICVVENRGDCFVDAILGEENK